MSRISFTGPDGALRWFDPAAAQAAITEGSRWDGNNHIGVCSGLQTSRAVLYLTGAGRWIENRDATHEFGGSDSYRFLSSQAAQEWLIRSADADRGGQAAQEALEKYFGEIPEESGPGRPEIGGAVHVRLGDELARVDAWAAKEGIKRAEAVRRLVSAGLAAVGAPGE